MSQQHSIGDLRKSVAKTYSIELEKSGTDPILNTQVIDSVKRKHPEQVSAVASQLIDRQINKLLNDERRKSHLSNNGDGPDLFGEFPNVRRSISVRRGETKALENLTVSELEIVVQRKVDRAKKKLEDDELLQILLRVKSLMVSDSDTVGDLIR